MGLLQRTDYFLARAISSFPCFSFLPIKRLTAIYQKTAGAHEGQDCGAPCSILQDPVLHAINERLRR